MNPSNEAGELYKLLASHGVYDGKTSLYFQEDVDSFAAALLALEPPAGRGGTD